MRPMVRKGLVIAVVHVALVSSLGAKLLIDRATRPRVWARSAPVDPNLPIRGRYVSLRLEVRPSAGLVLPEGEQIAHPDGSFFTIPPRSQPVQVMVEGSELVAVPGDEWSSVRAVRATRDGNVIAILEAGLAYFIPEGIPDPSVRATGEELWVEVTVPRTGLPRPIQLGVKKNGVITPLAIR